ncbi:unnamed protein product [Nezara viridula]|uniref:Neuropeptide n=1 Tax=Nezara viridula TaxID=85310 RepID=A0A9P0HV77_NEZVI|nr:unnamed protein product [Nezara viridula]
MLPVLILLFFNINLHQNLTLSSCLQKPMEDRAVGASRGRPADRRKPSR